MRYTIAVIAGAVIGISGVMQAAFAGEQERPQSPAPVVGAQYAPVDPGAAAPMVPAVQIPAVEHDRN